MTRLTLIALSCMVEVSCATRVIRPANTPSPQVQRGLAGLQRVWVAGFATDRAAEFDVNTETVRVLRTELRTWSPASIVEATPLALEEPKLHDVPYWRRLGEEHGFPLIVTGTVKLHVAPARVVQRGARSGYAYATGRVLESTVVLIDGHTGKLLFSYRLPSRMRYGVGRFSSGFWLFMQMMHAAIDDWFQAITRASTAPGDKARALQQGSLNPSEGSG